MAEHLEAIDLLKLARQVCRNVRPAWKDDFISRLAILSLSWANGYSLNQVRRYMQLRIRELYREENRHPSCVPLDEIPDIIAAPVPVQVDTEMLTRIYLAALSLTNRQRAFIAEWMDELLTKKHGAVKRSIAQCRMGSATADRAMKAFRTAYSAGISSSHESHRPKYLPVKSIADLLARLRRSSRRGNYGMSQDVRVDQYAGGQCRDLHREL